MRSDENIRRGGEGIVGEKKGRGKETAQGKKKRLRRIYNERKTKYDRMESASYKINLLTIISLFQLQTGLVGFLNRNHESSLD